MALTLRITKEENEQLDKLKKHFGLAANSKVISCLIEDYLPKVQALQETRQKLSSAEYNLKLLTDMVKERKEMDQKIEDFLKG